MKWNLNGRKNAQGERFMNTTGGGGAHVSSQDAKLDSNATPGAVWSPLPELDFDPLEGTQSPTSDASTEIFYALGATCMFILEIYGTAHKEQKAFVVLIGISEPR